MAGQVTAVSSEVAAGFEKFLEATDGGLSPGDGSKGVSPKTSVTERADLRAPTRQEVEEADRQAEQEAARAAASDEETPEQRAAQAGEEDEAARAAAEAAAAAGDEPGTQEGEGEDLDPDHFISTFAELAEEYGVEENDLLEHFTVPGRTPEESVSLSTVIEAFRNPAGTHVEELVQVQVAELKAESDTAMKALSAATAELVARVRTQKPPPGGWEALRKDEPGEYIRLRELQEGERQETEAALAMMDRETERRAGVEDEARKRYLREQARLTFELRPDWKERKVGEVAQKEIHDYLVTAGFPAEEIEGLDNARAMLTVWEAAQYRKSQQRKPLRLKRLKGLPRKRLVVTARDDTPHASDVDKRLDSDLARFHESGKIEDGLGLFEEVLRKQG